MGGFGLAWFLLPFLATLVCAQDCLPYIQQKNVNLTWVGSDPPSCSSCSEPSAHYFNNTKCSGDSDWNIGLNEFSVDLPPNSIVVQINAVAFANPTCAVGSSCTLGFLIQKTYLIVFDTPENASPDSCDLCTIQFTAQPPPTFCSGVSGFNYTSLNDLRIFTTFNSLCISAAQLQIFYIQAVPQVASVFPTSIPVSTDEVIAITGSDFTPTANLNCYLNGKVYPTTFVDYKKITCTIPAFASSTNENFSLAIGNSSATLFTAQVLFYVVPTVVSLSPDHASSHGISAVYLTGSSFFDGDDMVCKFGTNKAVQAQYVNSTCVKCVNPLDSSCTASYVNVTFSPNGEDYINVPGEFYFTGCETPLPTPASSPSPAPSTFPSQTPQPSPDPSPSPAPSATAHNRIDLPDNFWYYFAIAMLLILIIIVFAISIVYMKRKKPPRRKPRAVLFDGTDESNTYGSTSSSGGGGGPGGGGSSHDSLTNLLLNDPNTVQMSELSAWREIEKGSFGVIYQATWRGTTIAVKKLPSKMIEREFHREAALMRSLRHPNVLQYLGTAVSKTEICILMEYMAQGSLYRLLHDPSSSFVHERMRSICIDTAKGMNYLHQQDPPIIHRDLKSHNLLVDEHWRVKVCDFGLSRFYQANATMTACGTPSWTAPEVLRNERYTTKADVYGFGVVVWEMLARRDPFPGMPPFQIVFAVGTQGLRPSIDEDWDPRWVQLLQNCWAEDPKKRPNFEQILSILESMRD